MRTSHTSTWRRVKLGAIASFKTGKLNSNAARPGGLYPFFTCSQEVLRTDTYSFDTEAVLLAGNNANAIYPIHYYNGKFDAYQRTYVIRSLDETRLVNRYLYYALRLKLDLLRSVSTGAATKFLTLTILNDLDINVPPTPIQCKVVDILTAYDDFIENNARRIDVLEEMGGLIYDEWFVKFRFPGHERVKKIHSEFGVLPEGWRIARFSEVVEIHKGKKPPVVSQHKENGLVLHLLLDAIEGGPEQYTSPAGMVMVRPEDVVMVMDGARSGMVFSGLSGAIGSTLARLRPIEDAGFSPYLLMLMLQDRLFEIQTKNVGAAIPHANKEFMRMMKVVIPSSQLNRELDSHFEALSRLRQSLAAINRNLRHTRDLLLPRLISGEIDVENLDIVVPETMPLDEAVATTPETV